MALIDFTLSNARRFYSSMENPLGVKGYEGLVCILFLRCCYTVQCFVQLVSQCIARQFARTVAESRTWFYFLQWFVQLVSQRFWPLQGMLHCAMCFVQLVSQRIARQVARNIAQCNSVFRNYRFEGCAELTIALHSLFFFFYLKFFLKNK